MGGDTMTDIVIPFRPDMALACIDGKKVCTSRTKRYGWPGDTFPVTDGNGRSKSFVLRKIVQRELGYVARVLFIPEGVSSSLKFIELWKQLHPFKGYDPSQIVFVHFFEEVHQ